MIMCQWCRTAQALDCPGCHHAVCAGCIDRCQGCPACGDAQLPYCTTCGPLGDPEQFDDDSMWDALEHTPTLGECCICEASGPHVRHGLLLPNQGAIHGHGWGCHVCQLPPNGVLAVLCDRCFLAYMNHREPLKYWCAGYPGIDGRREIDDLPPTPFVHDMRRHQMAR